jgi:hypothetical protein
MGSVEFGVGSVYARSWFDSVRPCARPALAIWPATADVRGARWYGSGRALGAGRPIISEVGPQEGNGGGEGAGVATRESHGSPRGTSTFLFSRARLGSRLAHCTYFSLQLFICRQPGQNTRQVAHGGAGSKTKCGALCLGTSWCSRDANVARPRYRDVVARVVPLLFRHISLPSFLFLLRLSCRCRQSATDTPPMLMLPSPCLCCRDCCCPTVEVGSTVACLLFPLFFVDDRSCLTDGG